MTREQLTARDRQIIARILKVNHAGEHGAIRIYGAQIAVARWFHPVVVRQLQELQRHEIDHHHQFAGAMAKRGSKPCRLLFLWAWGGSILGFLTALLGERTIWICTEAVEDAVHHHLADQLRFLRQRDPELFDIIAAIQVEEQTHLDTAREYLGTRNWLSRCALVLIAFMTDTLILMSTSGDSHRLKKELGR